MSDSRSTEAAQIDTDLATVKTDYLAWSAVGGSDTLIVDWFLDVWLPGLSQGTAARLAQRGVGGGGQRARTFAQADNL